MLLLAGMYDFDFVGLSLEHCLVKCVVLVVLCFFFKQKTAYEI